MKKVSVILTTCNSEESIQRTLDSVLNQTGINILFELELLVIDDCSTDGTKEILKKNNIPFYSTPNNTGGPNKGRNIGLKKMTGNYFCLIDHDDVWHPDKVISQLTVAHRYPVVSTGYRVVNNYSNKISEKKTKEKGYTLYKENEAFLQKLQRRKNGQNLYMSTLMIDSSLKDILFEESFGMVDYDWLLRITENNTTAEIAGCYVTRFVTRLNLSLDEGYRQKDYYYSLYFLENYRKKYPAEYTTAIRRLNGTRARYHYIRNDMKEARRFFLKSEFSLKQVLYILTSFMGSRYINNRFAVFG